MDKFEDNEENRTKMDEVASYLQGTPLSLEEGLATQFGEDADAVEFATAPLERLYDQVMRCDDCGWWVETGEINDEAQCEECARSSEDKDDE